MQEQHFLAFCLRIALLAPSQSWVYWVESICWWNPRVLQRNPIYIVQLQMAGLVYFFTGFHRKNIMWGFPTLAKSSKSPFLRYLSFLQLRMNGQEVCLLGCLVFYSDQTGGNHVLTEAPNLLLPENFAFTFILKQYPFVFWERHLKSIFNLVTPPCWRFLVNKPGKGQEFDKFHLNVSHCYWLIRLWEWQSLYGGWRQMLMTLYKV